MLTYMDSYVGMSYVTSCTLLIFLDLPVNGYTRGFGWFSRYCMAFVHDVVIINTRQIIGIPDYFGFRLIHLDKNNCTVKPRFLMSGTLIFGYKTTQNSSTQSKLCTC